MELLKQISSCHRNWDGTLRVPLKENKDGGDALHRLSMQAIEWWLKLKVGPHTDKADQLHEICRKIFQQQLEAHYIGEGNFRRYWQPTIVDGIPQDWFCKDDVFSRDQSIPLIIALGLWGMTEWIYRIEEGLKANCKGGVCFYPNTRHNNPNKKRQKWTGDIVTPQIWGLIDKAKGLYNSSRAKAGDWAELADSKLLEAEKLAGQMSHPKIWNPFSRKFVYPRGKYVFRHGDPVNKTLILLYNKVIGESKQAREARIRYCNTGNVFEYWEKYWVRPGDPQCPFHVGFRPYIYNLQNDYLI